MRARWRRSLPCSWRRRGLLASRLTPPLAWRPLDALSPRPAFSGVRRRWHALPSLRFLARLTRQRLLPRLLQASPQAVLRLLLLLPGGEGAGGGATRPPWWSTCWTPATVTCPRFCQRRWRLAPGFLWLALRWAQRSPRARRRLRFQTPRPSRGPGAAWHVARRSFTAPARLPTDAPTLGGPVVLLPASFVLVATFAELGMEALELELGHLCESLASFSARAPGAPLAFASCIAERFSGRRAPNC